MEENKSGETIWLIFGAIFIAILSFPGAIAGLVLYLVARFVPAIRWWYVPIAAVLLLAIGVLVNPTSTFESNWWLFYKIVHAVTPTKPSATDVLGMMQPKMFQNAKTFALGNVIWSALVYGSFGSSVVLLIQNLKSDSVIKNEEQKLRERQYQESPYNQWQVERAAKRHKQGSDGVLLGVDRATRNPVILSAEELNNHTALFGTTGAGKTTTIKTFVEAGLEQNKPVLFIDGKGDKKLIVTMRNMAQKYGVPFRVFTFTGDQSWQYNPLSDGTYTEFKDRLIAATDWGSEPFFKGRAETYLQLMFRIFELVGERVDLVSVVKYFQPEALLALLKRTGHKDLMAQYKAKLESYDVQHLQGMADSVRNFVESFIGELFEDQGANTIRLTECFEDGGITLFSLDSKRYPEFARKVGRLVTTDMKAAASIHGYRSGMPVAVIFDEFNVFASTQVVDLINKSRSDGVEALIASQSLADLDIVDPIMRRQVIQNCNTVIIQRQNDPTDAEELAAVVGTEETYGMTYQTGDDLFGGPSQTGRGSMRKTREFIVHPDDIKRLGRGEAVIVRKIPNFQVNRLKIRFVEG